MSFAFSLCLGGLLFSGLAFGAFAFGARAQATGYSPPRMSPAFGSSFISLRGAPGAVCTMSAALVLADQQVL